MVEKRSVISLWREEDESNLKVDKGSLVGANLVNKSITLFFNNEWSASFSKEESKIWG